jgi:hypothetical protein
MDIKQLSHLLQEKWNEGKNKSINDLEKNMYNSIRNLDFDGSIISDLVATVIPFNTVPLSTLDIVLGLVADEPMELTLELGGKKYGDKIVMSSMNHVPILSDNGKSWPLVVTTYHEIKIRNISAEGRLWALGVRVNKEFRTLLSQPLEVPGILKSANGNYHLQHHLKQFDEKCEQWESFNP